MREASPESGGFEAANFESLKPKAEVDQAKVKQFVEYNIGRIPEFSDGVGLLKSSHIRLADETKGLTGPILTSEPSDENRQILDGIYRHFSADVANPIVSESADKRHPEMIRRRLTIPTNQGFHFVERSYFSKTDSSKFEFSVSAIPDQTGAESTQSDQLAA
jgi:hypothetical protein